MVSIDVDRQRLTVRFTRAEKILGLVADLTVPRSSVLSARVVANGLRQVRGWRVGTRVPGVVALGTFRWRGRRQLGSVRRGRPALVLVIGRGRYDEMVVSVDDAERVRCDVSGLG
jgi:hypothetical protein